VQYNDQQAELELIVVARQLTEKDWLSKIRFRLGTDKPNLLFNKTQSNLGQAQNTVQK
jgi:hypothetical protein